MIPEVGGGGGTRPWGPRGKGSLSVSKGPKPPIQLLQLLKNIPREAKRVHFRYILGPPDHLQEMKLMGPGGKVPPGPPPPPVSPAMPATWSHPGAMARHSRGFAPIAQSPGVGGNNNNNIQ